MPFHHTDTSKCCVQIHQKSIKYLRTLECEQKWKIDEITGMKNNALMKYMLHESNTLIKSKKNNWLCF